MGFRAGAGERQWVNGVLGEVLTCTAEGLGVVLPEPDSEVSAIATYGDEGLGRRVTVYPPYEQTEGSQLLSVYPPGEQCGGFWMRLQSHGVTMAGGWIAEPAEVVRATAAWISGAGLIDTKAQAPCVEFRPWALAHEQEPFGAVELVWHVKLDRFHTSCWGRTPRTNALLVAAYAQPALRRLTPITSHFNVWFSTRIEPSEKSQVGYGLWEGQVGFGLFPHDERLYGVRRRGGELVARTETPEEAVALVVAALPEGLGLVS
ncbi:DUF6193 family natural product biosynthesis protein [Kitasatospora sp. NPDC059648]|uniref:DUF6193 family natural product biosynthesis protein n=1 Tax=Kitasatospora sp. NPDC059648 TaxID=3346894 RepID=UPI0036CFE883